MLKYDEIRVLEFIEEGAEDCLSNCWVEIYLDLEFRGYIKDGELTENGRTALAMWREV